jgi:tetratricopeptide (TPR) repeat protein
MLPLTAAHADEASDCARGFAAVARGFDDLAIHYCSQVLRSPRFSPSQKRAALNFRALAYERSSGTAVSDIEAAALLLPPTFENLVVRALVQVRSGNLEAAADSFTGAIAENPNDARVYYNRGLAFHLLQRFGDAVQDYRRSIEIDPSESNAYYNLGLAHFELGNMQAAVKAYSQAIELSPSYAQAIHNRAHAYERLGQTSSALKDFRVAVELAPEDPTIMRSARARGIR